MFPTFTTPRFLLREILQADIDAIYKGLSDPRVVEHYGVSYDSLLATQTQMDWYRALQEQQEGLWWGICRPDAAQTLIGACGVNDWERAHRRIELGYWLLPEFWGDGVMRECLAPVIEHAFTVLNVHRVEAVVVPQNIGSCRLLQRLGFIHEGTRRECELKRGQFNDLDHYGLLRTDWRP